MLINNIDYEIPRFSSGEMKLRHKELQKLVKDNCVKILYNGQISFLELMLIIEYYKSQNTRVELTLSYLPYQRMDKNNEIEVTTIELVAHIINSLKLDKLFVCEPHCSLQNFNNVNKISLIDSLFEKIKNDINITKSDKICFPDMGAKNKYENLASNYIYFEKKRALSTGLIDSFQMIGNLNDTKRVVIIDDIISTGDTIQNIVDNISKDIDIYIVCGHFENNKYNLRLTQNPQIKAIYTSNSLNKKQFGNLKVFDIKDLI